MVYPLQDVLNGPRQDASNTTVLSLKVKGKELEPCPGKHGMDAVALRRGTIWWFLSLIPSSPSSHVMSFWPLVVRD